MLKTIIPPTTPVLIEDLGMHFPTEKSKKKMRFGIYKCHCGKEFRTITVDVTRKRTVSCGCNRAKHGLSSHRLYGTWCGMISRTTNVNDKYFAVYGGRGITVCSRWLDIENFIEDIYPTWEEGLTIDRIDNDGNYEPKNIRLVSLEVQARNTTKICSSNTSGYRGVHLHKPSNKWIAKIRICIKCIHLGYFATALDAAKAYDGYVIEHNLEHTINSVLYSSL